MNAGCRFEIEIRPHADIVVADGDLFRIPCIFRERNPGIFHSRRPWKLFRIGLAEKFDTFFFRKAVVIANFPVQRHAFTAVGHAGREPERLGHGKGIGLHPPRRDGDKMPARL